MPDRTRSLLRRRARPSTARASLVALVLVVVCASATAPAAAEPTEPAASSDAVSVIASDTEIVAQDDDVPAGSGGADESGEPSAWNGVLGLLAWVLVAALAFGFLMWMLFLRPRRGRADDDTADGDDDVPDRGAEPGR
jgi:hypothetical protein